MQILVFRNDTCALYTIVTMQSCEAVAKSCDVQ